MYSLPSLIGTDDTLIDIPTRLLTSWGRDASLDQFIKIAIRVVIVGGLVAGLRQLFTWTYNRIRKALFPTAYIAVTDSSYLWVMAWIAQDPSAQCQIKDFQLSTSEWREVRQRSSNALRTGEGVAKPVGAVGEQNATWVSKDVIGQVIPTYHQSIKIKHNGTYLWVTRKMGIFARSKLRTVDHLQILTIAYKPNTIKNFLIAAHQAYFAKEETELLIFHPLRINPAWQKPVSRPSRPWSSVILPGTTKQDILKDITKFLSEKEILWYAARGIPHRRGYLFHGDPGSGKTTLATAIASKLRLDIYVINPSQRGMDDAKLSKLFRDCPARSIILIEDIDCIFPAGSRFRRLTVETGDDEEPATNEVPLTEEPTPEVPLTPAAMTTGSRDLGRSTVTLSGMLNAIDGVSSQEGCILIASTNHPNRLDPALQRAGRFDVRVPFSNATPGQAHALFLHFYPLTDFSSEQSADQPLADKAKHGIFSQIDLDDLATRFAQSIFGESDGASVGGVVGKSVSMAALQGYLLGFKDDPILAVEEATKWAAALDTKVKPLRSLGLPPAPSTPGPTTLSVPGPKTKVEEVAL